MRWHTHAAVAHGGLEKRAAEVNMQTSLSWKPGLSRLSLALFLAAPQVFAQEAESGEPAASTSELDDDEAVELDQKTDAEDELSGPQTPPAALEEETDEIPSIQYLIGARYRMILAPKFLINAFGVDGGTDIVLHGVGPQFGIANKNFEIILSPWYADYGMSQTPFKGPTDGHDSWELVTSNLKTIYLTADFLWRFNVAKKLDWTVGVSGGVGIVFGELIRYEAYWTNGRSPTNPGDPYVDLAQCGGPLNPNAECDVDGSYGSEPFWPVYPWLSFQTGLRYQPVKEFIGRLDLGVGSSGFWLGLGADFGL